MKCQDDNLCCKDKFYTVNVSTKGTYSIFGINLVNANEFSSNFTYFFSTFKHFN